MGAALSEMIAAQQEEVEKLVRHWVRKRKRSGAELDAMEVQIREWALGMGRIVIERMIQGMEEGRSAERAVCRKCGRPARREGRRAARIHTTMGDVEYRRGHVRCRACRERFCPLDEELGLDGQQNSPALQRIVSLAGAVAPFEKASDLLGEIGSIPIAATKVERMSEQSGRQAQEWIEARQQRARAGLDVPGGPVVERLYVEADGTTAPLRRESLGTVMAEEEASPPEAAKEKAGPQPCRPPTQRTAGRVEWKEVKLGAVFEATLDEAGHPRSGPKTYTGTFEDAETCVRQVLAEAKARGSDRAGEIVVLCDGGTWLWNRLPAAFEGRRVTQILDVRHPEERLTEIGTLMWGEGTSRAREWSERQRGRLYDGHTREVIEEIEGLAPKSREAKESIRQNLGYFRENQHRMNYGELRSRGYFIGSGVIESSCKHIVGARFKQAGMKWSRSHAPRILGLRICRASGWWDSFWKEVRHREAA